MLLSRVLKVAEWHGMSSESEIPGCVEIYHWGWLSGLC